MFMFLWFNMKNLSVDDNAHKILMDAKVEVKKSGIEKPSHSDAIRWMWNKIVGEQK